MPLTKYTQAPLPDYGSFDDIAQILADYTDTVDPHFVLFADTIAERNSKYGDAPVDTVVISAAMKQIWVKQDQADPNAWWTPISDTDWVATGIVPGAGWSINVTPEDPFNSNTQVRTRNGVTDVVIDATRTGADIVPGTGGNIGDETICTLPAQFKPNGRARNGTVRYAGQGVGYVNTTGGVIVTCLSAGLTLASGGGILFTTSYISEAY